MKRESKNFVAIKINEKLTGTKEQINSINNWIQAIISYTEEGLNKRFTKYKAIGRLSSLSFHQKLELFNEGKSVFSFPMSEVDQWVIFRKVK